MKVACTLLLCFAVLACTVQQPVCTAPYIQNGNTCCLDNNNDTACDTTEKEIQTDCSLCPPRFVTQKEAVTEYKYVCMNESIMDTPQDCGTRSNADLFTINKQHNETIIETFEYRAACRGEYQAAELHLVLTKPTENITWQIQREPQGAFTTLGSSVPATETYYYIGFCSDECTQLTDARLPATSAYVVRAYLKVAEQNIFTREYIIDPTTEGDIGRKDCS